MLESLTEYGDLPGNRRRLFRLQWQDMIEAISEAMLKETQPNQLVLNDVKEFLRVRQLEYFKGFIWPASIQSLRGECGSFYTSAAAFRGSPRLLK